MQLYKNTVNFQMKSSFELTVKHENGVVTSIALSSPIGIETKLRLFHKELRLFRRNCSFLRNSRKFCKKLKRSLAAVYDFSTSSVERPVT